jgi:UDP-GlcNAc:undecaprenyl-phosphate GlcNAc-1-phosphate transferase
MLWSETISEGLATEHLSREHGGPVLASLLIFGVALATSFILTIPVRRVALRWGMVDPPGPRKVHKAPVPLLGGVAIYCGAVLAVVLFKDGQSSGQIFGILAASTFLLVVGILDDGGWLHHQIKLFAAMPVAALTLLSLGIRTHIASAFLPGPLGTTLDAGLSLLWIVGITAAFSILDHMDGLVSGVAAIACFFFTVLAILNGQVMVSILGAAVFGASLGFLRWNFNPASIFMGDGGAMFLGFMVATLGLKLRLANMSSTTSWMVPVLVLAVPIFDTTLISISRLRRGLIPFTSPGKDHAAHRLANLGLGQRGGVLLLYGMGVLFGLLTLALGYLSVLSAYVLAGSMGFSSLAAALVLEHAPYERQEIARRAS